MTVGSKKDAYLQKDIDKLEKVQRQAARFISGGYTSRDHGCVTQLLTDLHLHHSKTEGKLTVLLQGGPGAGAGTADP